MDDKTLKLEILRACGGQVDQAVRAYEFVANDEGMLVIPPGRIYMHDDRRRIVVEQGQLVLYEKHGPEWKNPQVFSRLIHD